MIARYPLTDFHAKQIALAAILNAPTDAVAIITNDAGAETGAPSNNPGAASSSSPRHQNAEVSE